MRGRLINQQQVELYMKGRKERQLTQEASAAQSGISVRSGRTIEKGQHCSLGSRSPRQYKTRKSALDDVWESELKGLLAEKPDLQPRTLLLYLQDK